MVGDIRHQTGHAVWGSPATRAARTGAPAHHKSGVGRAPRDNKERGTDCRAPDRALAPLEPVRGEATGLYDTALAGPRGSWPGRISRLT